MTKKSPKATSMLDTLSRFIGICNRIGSETNPDGSRRQVSIREVSEELNINGDELRDLIKATKEIGVWTLGTEPLVSDSVIIDSHHGGVLEIGQTLGLEVQRRLTLMEVISLTRVLNYLKSINDPEHAPVITACVEKLYKATGRDWIGMTDAIAASQSDPHLACVRKVVDAAHEQHKAMSFAYLKEGERTKTTRVVAPAHMFPWQEFWYLAAKELPSEAVRTFRFDRMSDVELRDDIDAEPASLERDPRDPFSFASANELKGLISRGALWLTSIHPINVDDPDHPVDENRFDATIKYHHPSWVENLVMQHGGNLVVHDEEIAQHVLKRVDDGLEAYAAFGITPTTD